ncbi:unnamed protein product [Orchesella dallaii]|uniref:Protein ZIP4 homolog n=1 Tax=Orchesella dallaii TaxID=48710 RepID=A0ABP1RHG8_9HEXA
MQTRGIRKSQVLEDLPFTEKCLIKLQFVMEKRQQQYITKHLKCLVEITNCNITLMASLIENRVLGKADWAHLDSQQNNMTKSYELYKLVMTKKGAFPYLKDALKKSVNTGALATLNKYSEDNESPLDSDNECGCSSSTEDEGNNFSNHEKLRVHNDMALTLKAMGKGWECLVIQEKILIEMMSLYGLEDWQTLETMIDVLNCLKTLGYFDNPVDSNVQNQHGLAIEPSKIISLVKVAHESKKELIGKDANWTTLMRLMATFLCDIEDYENARAISNDIYGRTKNCSTYRGHAIYCLNLMGRSKSEEGKVKDALEMYENAYQFFKTALGSNHLDTLRIRREMFMTLSNLDGADTDTVLEGLQDILEAIQMHHPNHEDATLTEIQIGITMIKMGKYSEGLKRIVKSKAKLQESYGLSAGTLTNINWWIERAQRNMKTMENHQFTPRWEELPPELLELIFENSALKQRRSGSDQEIEDQSLPFPTLPLVSALLQSQPLEWAACLPTIYSEEHKGCPFPTKSVTLQFNKECRIPEGNQLIRVENFFQKTGHYLNSLEITALCVDKDVLWSILNNSPNLKALSLENVTITTHFTNEIPLAPLTKLTHLCSFMTYRKTGGVDELVELKTGCCQLAPLTL